MKYYIAFDGGGSKLQGVLFDETGTILGSGFSGGVNGNVNIPEAVASHVEDCVAQMFRNVNPLPERITAIVTSQGVSWYRAVVENYVPCEQVIDGGEGVLGLLACGFTDGICALAGTGSDIFYVKDMKCIDVVGGWGYLLHDDGSGVWIGVQAARWMAKVFMGVEQTSLLMNLLQEAYGIYSYGQLLGEVYSRKATATFYLGSFCRVVQQAAEQGDEAALRIQREAGTALAELACLLIEKHKFPVDTPFGLTGSVFRHCPAMRESFIAYLQACYPGMVIRQPRFEPVIGGMILGLLHSGKELNEELMETLSEKCKAFRIITNNL